MRRYVPAALCAIAMAVGPAAAANASPSPSPAAVRQTASRPHAAPAGADIVQGLGAAQSNLLGSKKVPHVKGDGDFAALGPCPFDIASLCYTPPDPYIAAGPNELIETVNCTIATYSNTTGAQLAVNDVRALFNQPASGGCSDPRVIYIPWLGRFAIVYWDTSASNTLRFAVSTDPNPGVTASSWHEYSTPSGSDQPKLEATENNLIVAGNAGDVEQYYVYDLSQVASGAANPAMQPVTGTVGVSQASTNYNASPKGYFIQSDPGQSRLSVISGTAQQGNVSISYQTFPSLGTAQPSDPAVPGGAIGGGDMDDRPLTAAYEIQNTNGHPVFDYSGNAECGTKVCIYDIKLDLSTTPATIVKNLRISSPSGQDYTYGSVTLDPNGKAILAYSASDANNTPSAALLADNDAGTVLFNSTIQAATPGTSSCTSTDVPPCDERWGDYLQVVQDPDNPMNVWGVSMFQSSDGTFGWGTAFAKANATGILSN